MNIFLDKLQFYDLFTLQMTIFYDIKIKKIDSLNSKSIVQNTLSIPKTGKSDAVQSQRIQESCNLRNGPNFIKQNMYPNIFGIFHLIIRHFQT